MKNIVYIIGAVVSMTFASCENFLDVNPKAEVVNEDMFDNAQGCEDAINGIYGRLKDNSLFGEYYNWGILDILSQDLSVSSQISPNYYFKTYDYTNAASIVKEMWQYPYEVIGYINNAITNLEDKKDGEFPLQNIYKGELYGLRALLHFELVQLFAPHIEKSPNEKGIPYVTTYSTEHTPFSTVSEVYSMLEKDLNMAKTLLEQDKDYFSWPRVDEGTVKFNFMKYRQIHMNYYAVTALLARVLRMKGDYSAARTCALEVINSAKFPLATKDEVTNLIAGVVSTKESLFSVYSTSYVTTTKLRLYDGASWTSYSPYQWSSGASYLFNYESLYASDLGNNAGLDSRLGWIRSLTGGSSVKLLKCVDVTFIENSAYTTLSRGLIDGISIMRIPEMYYIVAEAYLQENNEAQAKSYINTVLLSRGLTKLEDRSPVLSATKELLYNERYKELFGEGQRWFDMKKLNMDISSNEELRVIPASDDVYVFPIPQEEFDYRNN